MNKNRPSLLPLSPLLLLLLLLLLPSPSIVHAASSRLREQKRDDKQLPPSATSGREEVEVDASGVSSSISNTGKLTVKQDEVRQRLLAVDDSEQLVAEWKDHLEKFKGYMDMGAADIEVFKGHRDTQAADVEMFKGYRDIQAAENFTALDFLSLRGFVLSLTPDDTDPTIYPMCELFKIGGPLRLHCIILGITARCKCDFVLFVWIIVKYHLPLSFPIGMGSPISTHKNKQTHTHTQLSFKGRRA